MDSMISSLNEQIYCVMSVPLQFSREEDVFSNLATLPPWEGGIQTHKQTIITQRVNITVVRSTGSFEASKKQLTCWEDWGMLSGEAEPHGMARKQPGERRQCSRALIQLTHQDEGQHHGDTEYAGTARVGLGNTK